jgi:DNA polymerase delta subunit 4
MSHHLLSAHLLRATDLSQPYLRPVDLTGYSSHNMAPKRRTASSRSAASNQQSKLSFSNKVTKPGSNQQTKSTKKDPSIIEDVARADVKIETEPDTAEPTTAHKVVQQQAEEEIEALADPEKDATTAEDVLGGRARESDVGAVGGKGSGWVANEEAEARDVSDAQIKKYWRQKEQERLAPRVHQEDLTVYEKVLREWDMSGQYGVSGLDFIFICALLLTLRSALHWHSTAQALEASEHVRSHSASRSTRCTPKAD